LGIALIFFPITEFCFKWPYLKKKKSFISGYFKMYLI